MNRFSRDWQFSNSREKLIWRLFPFFFGIVLLIILTWIGFVFFMAFKYGPQTAESGINLLDSVSDALKQKK